MNFRQRVSWLLVVLYLAATCAIVYYVFEISDRFNQFALDHINHYNHSGEKHSWWHIADIPVPVLMLIVVLPYLQVFCMLLACTKPDPRFSMAYLWPMQVAVVCVRFYRRCTQYDKAVNCPVPNGHILIDT